MGVFMGLLSIKPPPFFFFRIGEMHEHAIALDKAGDIMLIDI
jgi:hypothetical protein